MSETESSELDLLVATLLCPYCEAPQDAGAGVCKSCGNSSFDSAANPYKTPKAVAPPEISDGTRSAISLVSVLLTGVFLVLLLGIGFQNPGVAILLALLTIPPWIRTAMVMRQRSKAGLGTGKAATVAMFVGSVFITWLILFIALVSCFLTFCFACIGAIAVSKDESAIMSIAGVAALAVFVVVILAFTPLIRHRYRRDSQKK